MLMIQNALPFSINPIFSTQADVKTTVYHQTRINPLHLPSTFFIFLLAQIPYLFLASSSERVPLLYFKSYPILLI